MHPNTSPPLYFALPPPLPRHSHLYFLYIPHLHVLPTLHPRASLPTPLLPLYTSSPPTPYPLPTPFTYSTSFPPPFTSCSSLPTSTRTLHPHLHPFTSLPPSLSILTSTLSFSLLHFFPFSLPPSSCISRVDLEPVFLTSNPLSVVWRPYRGWCV